MNQLTPKTIEYIENVDIKHRKNFGQYFTPKELRTSLLSKLPKKNNPKILDPGCGTGEFLLTAKEYFKDANLFGWDIDKKLTKIAKDLVPEADIQKTNTLEREIDQKYDFIIGNPPYFEFKPNKKIKQKYKEILYGRINIYSLFIYKSIQMLKEGGYLAFVVPPSMNNGAYFKKLRKFIVKNCNIEYLETQKTSELFQDALQSVMLIILKKRENNGDYIFSKNGILIFTENKKYLEKAFKKKKTLTEVGYQVRTGKIVWNQNKDRLTNNKKEGVPLIWSHNITENGLNLEVDNKKPQFIKTDKCNVGPAIVVNRIVGQPGKGKVRAAFIPEGKKFMAENHVNVIKPSEQPKLYTNRKKGLKDLLTEISSDQNAKIIQSITGNTQISKTELENLFPVGI